MKLDHILYREEPGLDAYAQARCRLELEAPEGRSGFATVVFFHGGGLTDGQPVIPEAWRNQGFAVVAAGYRLSPQVQAPTYIEDAAAAVAWVYRNIERHGGSRRRIFLCGASAGGYLALLIGLDRRWLAAAGVEANELAGLISLTGQTITHFTVRGERGLPAHQPVVDELAPLFHVRPDAPPVLLVTGDRELELFGRYEESAYFRRLMLVAGHTATELYELPGVDHGGVEAKATPHLLQFVQTVTAHSDKESQP